MMYTNTGNNILQNIFVKYKSKISTMYNLYKLINYRYINYTLNTASGQGVRTDIILSFNMFYLKIVFLQH